MKIYLDVCCLNRPFDNLEQDRVTLEMEAIFVILNRCEFTDWELINSDVILEEIKRTPNWDKQKKLKQILSISRLNIVLNETIENRANKLRRLGFKIFDALHIASAEEGQANILLTTDDRLLRKAINYANELKIEVANPVQWLMSIIQGER